MTTATITPTLADHKAMYCSDLLSAAIEGGIGYWAKGRRFQIGQKGTHLEGCYTQAELKPHNDEGPAFEDGDKRNDWQVIDLAKIEAAVELILAPGAKLARQDIVDAIRADWADPAECYRFDAETGDVVVQIALFGEIVFG